MPIEAKETSLLKYLKDKSATYYGKTEEVRDLVEDWLSYTTGTFQHYTRHTIKHSDKILHQISKILFKDGSLTPTVELSGVEAYILIISAYLHDAGMVVSEKEKLDILSSAEWQDWVSEGQSGFQRWNEIITFRNSIKTPNEDTQHFIANLKTRFLIAEFVRRQHHVRSGELVNQFHDQLGRLAFDDKRLVNAIADVCIAHGLSYRELEDRDRYPFDREIRDEKVNLRFLAILLRLGDLLDMDSDRACPLLLNAACPLPSDSFAHWSLYQCISHFSVTPNKIEITAECENQNEHRLLHDWCQWIVDEVNYATTIMAHSTRFKGWIPPKATMGHDGATITIRPSKKANYIPSEWKFEFNQELIFQRLIKDAYYHPAAFIRELVQNSIDATRCQVYLQLQNTGQELPEYPTKTDKKIRYEHPIKITVESREFKNEITDEVENKDVLTVVDTGVGMDNDIIHRFFLQIGSSFYTTNQFRRDFRFNPTSKFGIGFLSVFAVSRLVKVETFKSTSIKQDGPILLTLTGPKNYLLTEKGTLTRSGTKIEVVLDKPMPEGDLIRFSQKWFKKVEFPIYINDHGNQTLIENEQPGEFCEEVEEFPNLGCKFEIKVFSIDKDGIEGEIYIFSHLTEKGENWAHYSWANNKYLDTYPQASVPKMPGNLTCYQGIASSSESRGFVGSAISTRIDVRCPVEEITIAREGFRSRGRASLSPMHKTVLSRIEEILIDHLQTSPYALDENCWKYKQKLMSEFSMPEFWRKEEKTLRMYINEKSTLLSLLDFQELNTITVISNDEKSYYHTREIDEEQSDTPNLSGKSHALLSEDFKFLNNSFMEKMFYLRKPINLRWTDEKYLTIDWINTADDSASPYKLFDLFLVELPTDIIGCRVHSIGTENFGLPVLNVSHPFTEWLMQLSQLSTEQAYGLSQKHYEKIVKLLTSAIKYATHDLIKLQEYISNIQKYALFPKELIYPIEELKREDFYYVSPFLRSHSTRRRE